MKKKVFIIVDMQEDFVNGALGTPEAKAIVENVKKRAEELRERWSRLQKYSLQKTHTVTIILRRLKGSIFQCHIASCTQMAGK